MTTRIAVIDHGAGNLVSMQQALVRAGAQPAVVGSADDLADVDGVVLPGVGATGPAMRTLRRTGLTQVLAAHPAPLLGVCVGMQLLFDHSTEDDTTCLGLLPGVVRRLRSTPLPHMGWNDVDHTGAAILGGTPQGTPFYFVHGFAPEPDDDRMVIGKTTYGSDTFASVVSSGRVCGVQFHPERSGDAGIAVLRAFVDQCREVADAA